MPARFNPQQGSNLPLMPLLEVAKRYNALTGERLTRGQVWWILRRAEQKLARLLAKMREGEGVDHL